MAQINDLGSLISSALQQTALLALLLGTAPTILHAQRNEAGFKRWTVDEGLPQNSVGQITQTRDGYLWVPTQGGIARFDGVRFQVFDVNTEPELKNNRVSTTFEDHKGRLFIGTLGGGLVVYENHTFKNISDQLGIGQQMVNQITQDKQGRIWVITEKSGILVLDDDSLLILKEYEALGKLNVQNIYETSSGEMILEHGRSTRIWNDGSLLEDHFYNQLPDVVYASSYSADSNTLWISGPTSLYKIQNHRLIKEYVIPPDYRYGNYVLGIFQLQTNQLLFSFNNSDRLITFEIDKEQFQPVDLDLQCPGTRIKYVFKDREENIWYATSTCGLIKANRFRPDYVDLDPAITNHNIYPIMKDSNGRIIIGTHNSGLQVIENGKSVNVPPKNAVSSSSYPYGVVEYKKDEYYIICNAQPFVTKSKDSKTTEIQNPGNGNKMFRSTYKTNSNELLFSANNGLFTLQDNQLSPHSLNDQLNGTLITSFFEDSRGNMWLLSDKVLFQYNKSNKEFKKFDSSVNFKTQFLRGSHEDNQGLIYFGSYGYGLLIYNGSRFYELTVTDGLFENVISTITDDGKGNLWLTGNKGLTKLRKRNLLAYLDKKDAKLNPILFDRSDGFRSAEFNGGMQQSKCEIEKNIYLFPTLNGCVKIDFNTVTDNLLPPPVIIESIKTEDSVYRALTTTTIPYNEGRTEFAFTALSFTSIKDVKFKYKLEGYDDGWKNSGTERKTSYTKITPGTYTFRVIACNNDGVWNETGASTLLIIAAPFQMTWWFRTIVGLIIAFALSTSVLLVDRKIKKKENEKLKQQQKQEMKSIVDAEERERKRIATDLHDSVGQLLTNVKLNVGMLSEKHNVSGQDKLLFDNSKKSLQEITAELRNISYNLHPPSLVQFGLVSAIEEEIKNVQLRKGIEIQFVNDTTDPRFNPDIELALYRVFQEIVNNIMKHSEATEVSVQLIQHDSILQLAAEDNGRGFIVDQGLSKKTSNGLKNLYSRVLLLDGSISIDSMPGRGTTIIIEIPLKV